MHRRLSRLIVTLAALAAPAGAASVQFQPPLQSPLPDGVGGSQPLVLANLDNNHTLYAVTTGPFGVTVSRSRPDGRFDFIGTVSMSGGAQAVAAGNLDRDQFQDLVVAAGDGSVHFLRGIGGGHFIDNGAFSSGDQGNWVVIASVDQDPFPDAIVACHQTGRLLIFHGDGNGFINGVNSASGGAPPTAIALQDFDGDTQLDVVAAEDDGAGEYGNSGGNFNFMGTLESGAPGTAIALGDVDTLTESFTGPDVILAASDGLLHILLNQGFNSFTQLPPIAAGGNAAAIDVGDFDGDGTLDIVTLDPNGRLQILTGHGDGNFDFSYAESGGGHSFVRVADLNLDGKPDLVLVDPNGSQLVTLINDTQNQPPPLIAENDQLTTDEDTLGSANVAFNDHGGSGSLFVSAVGPAANGTASIGPDAQSVSYQPGPNFNGGDSFTYTVSDGSQQASATVQVTVNAVNDPPVNTALPAITVASQKPLTLHAGNGLWSDVDGTASQFAFQWQRASSPTALPAPIPGATNANYATTSADTGKVLRVVVTATDNGTPLPGKSTPAASDWAATAPPANDDFKKAIALSGNSGTISGVNVSATKEAGEPNHALNSSGHSVWWSWKSPMKQGGTLTVDTFGSSFDTVLAAYTGNKVDALTAKAQNDNTFGPQSRVSFAVLANTVYSIAVDGALSATNPSTGAITLHWTFVASP